MGMVFKKLVDEVFATKDALGNPCAIDKKLILSLACPFEDGTWKYRAFQEFIWDNIAQTALSERERQSLADRHHSALIAAARNLRLTDKEDAVGAGSELAEAVLYGVMRQHFGAIPAVPKIFYKQNANDNAKGADSVHITISGDDFHLWLGEAKFYSSIESSRLGAIVASVGESLRSDKLAKENSLICNLGELESCISDKQLVERIKASLSSDVTIDEIKPKLHIPILLLHECSYTAAENQWSQSYEDTLIAYHRDRAKDYFERQMKALTTKIFKYEEITFHVILFPVPSKKEVVARFLSGVDYFKKEGS